MKAHVPMIKFRKGSMLPKPEPIIVEATPTIASVAAPSSQPHQWIPNQSINLEWWQTPQKFKRRNVDDLEIDIINVRKFFFYYYQKLMFFLLNYNFPSFFSEWWSRSSVSMKSQKKNS